MGQASLGDIPSLTVGVIFRIGLITELSSSILFVVGESFNSACVVGANCDLRPANRDVTEQVLNLTTA